MNILTAGHRTAKAKAAPEEHKQPMLTVDLAAVAANTRLFRDRIHQGAELMAVVKADGFGHGAGAVARTALANGADRLGVTSIAEAAELRLSGLGAPVLSWLNPVDAAWDTALRLGVEVAVPSVAHLAAVEAAAGRARRRARVHLHIDTGMARDGAPPALWWDLCARARRAELRGTIQVVGVMGHLGSAATPGDPRNTSGRLLFEDAARTARDHDLRPGLRHLAATAAALAGPAYQYDLCRIGAGLVGIDPSGTTRLHPAMTLTAPVIGVRDVPAGTDVGYQATYRTPRPTRLALIPLGYADGLPRAASNRARVWIRGQARPVVGLISMDQTVVDVGDETVAPGEVVTVFGDGGRGKPTSADWARWAGTIEHEIVTGIGPRVLRRSRCGATTAVAA
jgi:alanine racemase